MADEQIQALRARNDAICEKLGLPKFQKDETQVRGMSNAEYYPAAKGESWKLELMRVIDECMRCAGNREEFLILLRSEGYDATWTEEYYLRHTGWAQMPGQQITYRKIPERKHGGGIWIQNGE